jgi:hypothetical protein
MARTALASGSCSGEAATNGGGDRRIATLVWAIGASVLATSMFDCSSVAARPPEDELTRDFHSPPRLSRPEVWWDWMNGNVTLQGIRRDLEWMKEVGLGGAYIVSVSFDTPRIVERPREYYSPSWKEAVAYASQIAHRLDLSLGITGGPGWAGAGGPWVVPGQAMKKLVWSETNVKGGGRYHGPLAAPPAIAGPFQDVRYVSRTEAWRRIRAAAPPAPFYVDAAIIAYRAPTQDQGLPPSSVRSSDRSVDFGRFSSGHLSAPLTLPAPGNSSWIEFTYPQAQTMRSASIGISRPGISAYASSAVLIGRLEAQDTAGAYHEVAVLTFTIAPQVTVSFTPVTARVFKVTLSRRKTYIPDASPPVLLTDLVLSGELRVNEFERKAGFALADDYDSLATPASGGAAGIRSADVVDLTRRMSPDGTLDWDPPPGNWTVLRMGFSLTGSATYPAPVDGVGLQVDKLSQTAAHEYMRQYLGRLSGLLASARRNGDGIAAIIADSTEAGPQNWTDDVLAQFERLRGYDPRPWLPTLTGVLVNDAGSSDRFLWDFRRTIAQLRSEQYEAGIAAAAHAKGLRLSGEALENGRPELGDDIEMRRYTDVPTGAMWAFSPDDPTPGSNVADERGAASVAHVYGQRLAAGESFTTGVKPWGYAPRDLKPVVDLEFALGINHVIIHTSVHQPTESAPGMRLGIAGQDFNRHETWAFQAGPWVDYMARSCYLLSRGRFVADVAYFYGEEGPLTALGAAGRLSDAPSSYGYDFVNSDAILHQFSVKAGRLTTASGMSYRALQLGEASRRMTLPVLRMLESLVRQGAVIVGNAPMSSPSLADDETEFDHIKARLWHADGRGGPLGLGRVYGDRSIEEALDAEGAAPDFGYSRERDDREILFLHRRLDEGDLYFLSNRRNRTESFDASFRVAGKKAELWLADTGEIRDAPYKIEATRTLVPLRLAPYESVFVVFRKPSPAQAFSQSQPKYRTLAELRGPWRIAFQPGRGAPQVLTLDALQSWTESPDPGVRYFSGTATYTKTIEVPAWWVRGGTRFMLDLGEVRELAEVRLNGKSLPIVWKPPYRLDVTGLLSAGKNTLQIAVTDLWVNRLIGDAQPGVTHRYAVLPDPTIPTYPADSPLRPSGLLGPVTLMSSLNEGTRE